MVFTSPIISDLDGAVARDYLTSLLQPQKLLLFSQRSKMFSHWLDQPEKEVAEEENGTDGTHFTDVCNKIGDTEQMTAKRRVWFTRFFGEVRTGRAVGSGASVNGGQASHVRKRFWKDRTSAVVHEIHQSVRRKHRATGWYYVTLFMTELLHRLPSVWTLPGTLILWK